jgi:membrane protease YdiL (CAAX protease family)
MNDVESTASPGNLPPIISPPEVPASPAPSAPWGFWATIGLGIALLGIYFVGQSLVTIACVVIHTLGTGGKLTSEQSLAQAMDGDVISIALGLTAPATIFFIGWFIKLRRGPTWQDYLGWHWPKWPVALLWTGGLLLLWGFSELVTQLLQRPSVPEVMLTVYRTANFKPLLWLGIILVAPVVEELIFRGFMFRGWAGSRLGGWGTIVLTSFLWAAIHLQYDLYGVASIFCFGIFLGWMRLRTGSVLLCVVLHTLQNLVATIQVEFILAQP